MTSLLVHLVPASIPAWAVVLSLASASGCGLPFGICPAVRASRLDPVEAMRAERRTGREGLAAWIARS